MSLREHALGRLGGSLGVASEKPVASQVRADQVETPGVLHGLDDPRWLPERCAESYRRPTDADGVEMSSGGESISEPKMVMPPMATGNMQSQQMSVIGLKKFAEQVARPVAGQARIKAIAAITRNTGNLVRKNIPPLEEYGLKGYYFRNRTGATELRNGECR